jgi:lysozyme
MHRLLLLVATAALLMSCGGPPVDRARSAVSAMPRAVEVSYPAFGDRDPHDWDRRSPDNYPVHGIDVSRWQPDIDWPTARRSGVSFAFIKATEGVEELDPMFRSHWDAAGGAGVPRGAYHFYYFCAPAAEQARWFIRNVPRTPGMLPPVLDMEWNHRSPTCRKRPEGAVVRAEAETFLGILERHYGQRPIVYTSVDFYQDTGIGRLPRTEFWLRSVADHPRETYRGQSWAFWQYTGTGVVPGVPGPVDINVFHGSPAAWQIWRQ